MACRSRDAGTGRRSTAPGGARVSGRPPGPPQLHDPAAAARRPAGHLARHHPAGRGRRRRRGFRTPAGEIVPLHATVILPGGRGNKTLRPPPIPLATRSGAAACPSSVSSCAAAGGRRAGDAAAADGPRSGTWRCSRPPSVAATTPPIATWPSAPAARGWRATSRAAAARSSISSSTRARRQIRPLPRRGPPHVVVAKTYHGDKGQNAYAGMRALWRSPLGHSSTVRIAEPLAWLPELNVLVQGPIREELTLKELLCRELQACQQAARGGGAGDLALSLPCYIGKTAAGLAELHQCGVGYGEEVTWEDELTKIYKQRAKLAGPLPQLATAAEELLNHLRDDRRGAAPDAAAPAHRSFRPAQVLLAGGEIGFIDFDGFCQAEPALDMALFMATVKNLGINKAGAGDEDEDEDEQLPPDDARRLAGLRFAEAICDLFLAEYEKHAPVSRTRILLWEALDLLSLVFGSWIKLKLARLDNCLLTVGKASAMQNVREILLGEHGLAGRAGAAAWGRRRRRWCTRCWPACWPRAAGSARSGCSGPSSSLGASWSPTTTPSTDAHTDAAAAGAGSCQPRHCGDMVDGRGRRAGTHGAGLPICAAGGGGAPAVRMGPAWRLQIVVSPHDAAYPQLRAPRRSRLRAHAGRHLCRAGGGGVCCQHGALPAGPAPRPALQPCGGIEARGGPGALFAKLYAPAQYPPTRGQAFCALSHRLADWLETCVPGATVLRPAAYVAEDTAILYPWVPGVPLAEMEGRRARRDAEDGERTWCRSLGGDRGGAGRAARGAACGHGGAAAAGAGGGDRGHRQDVRAHRRCCCRRPGAAIQALLAAGRRGLCGAAAGSCRLYPRRFQGRPRAGGAGGAADPDRLRRLRAGGSGVRHRQVPGRPRLGVCCLPGQAISRRRGRLFSGATGCRQGHPRLQRAQVVAALILVKIAAHRVKLFDPTWAAQTLAPSSRGGAGAAGSSC